MDLALKGKVALVAGSSRGIGRAIAHSFLQEGARVIISGRQKEFVEATARAFQSEFGPESVMTLVGDLTNTAFIQASLKQIEDQGAVIDVVVANIGSGKAKGGWQQDFNEWTDVYEVNLFGTLRLINEVLPLMIEKGSGSVVMISSIVGVEATTAPLAYSSAKGALVNYGKNLSRLMAPLGVRVNVVAPGNILFEGGSWETHIENRPEVVSSYIEAEVPQARFGTPEEIAAFVVFLSSPKASFATGMCLAVDGGQTRTI